MHTTSHKLLTAQAFLGVHAPNTRDVMKVIVLYSAVIPCEDGDPL